LRREKEFFLLRKQEVFDNFSLKNFFFFVEKNFTQNILELLEQLFSIHINFNVSKNNFYNLQSTTFLQNTQYPQTQKFILYAINKFHTQTTSIENFFSFLN